MWIALGTTKILESRYGRRYAVRLALRAGPLRAQTAKSISLQAPVGGLNSLDALADMPSKDAVRLDNWFPLPDSVRLRKGATEQAVGFASQVSSLMSYSASSGARKLFAASGQYLYDVSLVGAIGSPVQSGLNSAAWQHATMSNSAGGQFLYLVNGVDAPRYFDGTSWTAPTLTGLATPSDLINVAMHKRRLWFVRKNTFEAYYLATDSVAGALSKFDVASLFRLGGHLVAMTSVTTSAGLTLDDYFAFISSEGEVAVYRGTDPASADTWGLVGLFRVGRPIGYRCVQKRGVDVLLLTADGITALQQMMRSDVVSTNDQVTRKVSNAIAQDVQNYSTNFGWQLILCPLESQFIVNVPESATTSHQFVQNTDTGAWCTFSGWDAVCWELHGDSVYFGTANRVIKANSGASDLGVNIVGDARQAFNYLGNRAQTKFVSMIRPMYSTTAPITTYLDVSLDFSLDRPGQSVASSGTPGALWGSGVWDVSVWGGSPVTQNDWLEVGGVGYCMSLTVQAATNVADVAWYATDVVYAKGGVL